MYWLDKVYIKNALIKTSCTPIGIAGFHLCEKEKHIYVAVCVWYIHICIYIHIYSYRSDIISTCIHTHTHTHTHTILKCEWWLTLGVGWDCMLEMIQDFHLFLYMHIHAYMHTHMQWHRGAIYFGCFSKNLFLSFSCLPMPQTLTTLRKSLCW